jgi:uncharacterized protein (DUF2252 family)
MTMDGRSMRHQVPRSSHGDWSPPANRPTVATFMRESERGRVAELLPLRYERMSASPFSFFRGAAALMAYDLSFTPTTGWYVQACGDAHLANFGLFATPERWLVFDLNDFDETIQAPWEWDLKRLAVSVMLAARANGLPDAAGNGAVLATARSYRRAIRGYANAGYLAVFYSELDATRVVQAIATAQRPLAQRAIQRATQHDHLAALAKLSKVVDGQLRIVDQPPLVTHPQIDDPLTKYGELKEAYLRSLRPEVSNLLERYSFVDAARKVVGVGSVGTRCFIALLTGRDVTDPLFLQIKEARTSALEPYVTASPFGNQGQRVVEGQRRIQAASDIFLGWGSYGNTQYYVRQLQDMKGSADLTRLTARPLETYGALCGWALARAHARTGNPVAIATYLGRGAGMDQAVARFSHAYADQTARDHATFVAQRS